MTDLSTVDPVAIVLTALKADSTVVAAFGDASHISGIYEAPWPHLRVTDGASGDMGELRWLINPEVRIEVYGDEANLVSEAECRRLLLVAALAVKRLETATSTAGQPTVTGVEVAGVPTNEPLTSGQTKFSLNLLIGCHP